MVVDEDDWNGMGIEGNQERIKENQLLFKNAQYF